MPAAGSKSVGSACLPISPRVLRGRIRCLHRAGPRIGCELANLRAVRAGTGGGGARRGTYEVQAHGRESMGSVCGKLASDLSGAGSAGEATASSIGAPAAAREPAGRYAPGESATLRGAPLAAVLQSAAR